MLSKFSLDYIRTRSSNPDQSTSTRFGRLRLISNPFNWPPISDQPIAKPLYLAIREYLRSIETLQFLGFQRAVAENLFADFTSPERQGPNSLLSLVDLAKEYITAGEVAADQNAQREELTMETDIIKGINLMQVYMGIDFEGPGLDLIDEPDMPLVLSTVTEWVISPTESRKKLLCNLNSVIRNVELANRFLDEDEKVEEEKAKQKVRNRKKGQAKRAANQRRRLWEMEG